MALAIQHPSRSLRAELRRIFETAKMPSSPAVAARILELIHRPGSAAADFADVIRGDGGLSARLLKMANSAYFGQRTDVTTVDRAVTVLGLRRVKMIALGVHLVRHLDRLGGAPFDMRTFWQHALVRACLARSIAQRILPARAEEAFLVGLLEDCGIVLLVQVLGCTYADLYRSGRLSPAAFYAVEKATFPHTHAEAIAAMAAEWRFPQIIAVPLARHHQPIKLHQTSSDVQRLQAVAYFVGAFRFAKDLRVDPSELELREFREMELGLDGVSWAGIEKQAADEYRRLSLLYANKLADDTDVAELLSEVNRQLAVVAGDADQRVLDVETERKQLLDKQERLARALADYREQAARDPLTGLLNRGALAQSARLAIQHYRDEATTIGALFVDIDNFKKLNDTYGHGVGDAVLKAVAACLVQEVGHQATVGRYGGEELAVILRGPSEEATRQTAERVVRCVRGLDFSDLGIMEPVTCSVGAVWTDHAQVASAEELFAAADRKMYQAKREGKDRCRFELLTSLTSLFGREDRRGSAAVGPSPSRKGCVERAGVSWFGKLRTIAERLNREKLDIAAEMGRRPRHDLIGPCVFHYFTNAGASTGRERACLRNISTGGVGLLVGRPTVRGEPVEVELVKGGSQLFLAGLVAHCRHIEGGIHETGVQLVTHSSSPIISGDPQAATRDLDWVANALRAKQGF